MSPSRVRPPLPPETEVVFAGFENAALERMSLACQLHFMRALVRNLVEHLEFANLRISQTAG